MVRANGLEEYWICTSAHVARGRLFRHNRRPTEARAELERAVGLARRGAGLVEWSYALTTLAELLRELGDRRAARELVLEARELLSRSPEPGTLAPRLVEQLESALRLVVDVSGARPVVIDELTAREQTVLGLLPTGLSAREIADELGISRDTVKTHTKRIYQKLGVSSRRERRRARPRAGTALDARRPEVTADGVMGAHPSWPHPLGMAGSSSKLPVISADRAGVLRLKTGGLAA